jgi:hypothetical protein
MRALVTHGVTQRDPSIMARLVALKPADASPSAPLTISRA